MFLYRYGICLINLICSPTLTLTVLFGGQHHLASGFGGIGHGSCSFFAPEWDHEYMKVYEIFIVLKTFITFRNLFNESNVSLQFINYLYTYLTLIPDCSSIWIDNVIGKRNVSETKFLHVDCWKLLLSERLAREVNKGNDLTQTPNSDVRFF